MVDNEIIYKCPHCEQTLALKKRSIRCGQCENIVRVVKGVPVLVKNTRGVESEIKKAIESGRQHWYNERQGIQWKGPYRHHLLKRRVYLDGLLKRLLKKRAGTVVDIGCGDGDSFKWLKKYALALYGCDYNLSRLINVASKAKEIRQVFMADITKMPVAENTIDLAFMNHVLEHIKKDSLVLKSIYRCLKPGGMLIIGVPNEGAAFWQLAYKLQPEIIKISDHVNFYTADTLRAKCERVGFKTIEVKHIGWGVPHWWLDSQIRGYKWVDDIFELIGSLLFPKQATSLYLTMKK